MLQIPCEILSILYIYSALFSTQHHISLLQLYPLLFVGQQGNMVSRKEMSNIEPEIQG